MAHVLGHGSPRDLMFEIIQSPPRLAYVFDLTRSKPQDCSFGDTCAVIEELKNGVIHNLKYKVETRLQNPACVVVFCNFLPSDQQRTLLSMDRWIIFELTEADIPEDIKEKRKEDIQRREELINTFKSKLKGPSQENIAVANNQGQMIQQTEEYNEPEVPELDDYKDPLPDDVEVDGNVEAEVWNDMAGDYVDPLTSNEDWDDNMEQDFNH